MDGDGAPKEKDPESGGLGIPAGPVGDCCDAAPEASSLGRSGYTLEELASAAVEAKAEPKEKPEKGLGADAAAVALLLVEEACPKLPPVEPELVVDLVGAGVAPVGFAALGASGNPEKADASSAGVLDAAVAGLTG